MCSPLLFAPLFSAHVLSISPHLRQPGSLALSAVTLPLSIPNLQPRLPPPPPFPPASIPSISSLLSLPLYPPLSFPVILWPFLCRSFASRRAICRGGEVVQERDDTRVTGNHGNTCSLSKCRPHQCWIGSITASLSAPFPSIFPFFSLPLLLVPTWHQLSKGKKENGLFLPARFHPTVPHLTS